MPTYLETLLRDPKNREIFISNVTEALQRRTTVLNFSRVLNGVVVPPDFIPNQILKKRFPKDTLPESCLDYSEPNQNIGHQDSPKEKHSVVVALPQIISEKGGEPGKALLRWCYFALAVSHFEVYGAMQHEQGPPQETPPWLTEYFKEASVAAMMTDDDMKALACALPASFAVNIVDCRIISDRYPSDGLSELGSAPSVRNQMSGLLNCCLQRGVLLDEEQQAQIFSAMASYPGDCLRYESWRYAEVAAFFALFLVGVGLCLAPPAACVIVGCAVLLLVTLVMGLYFLKNLYDVLSTGYAVWGLSFPRHEQLLPDGAPNNQM